MAGLQLTPSGAEALFYAPTADRIEVCIFTGSEEKRHSLVRDESGFHRGAVPGARAGDRYGLRTDGRWDPDRGLWHDPRFLLVDPFTTAVSGGFADHPAVHHDGPSEDTSPWVPRSLLAQAPPPPRPGPAVPWCDTVIYETHVRNLTMLHPGVESGLRGTYLGAASTPVIDHLVKMGVTTVELMPVAHHVTEPFLQARGLRNNWGYSTLAWFAPHAGYATGDDGRQVAEFAEMVDRFHAAGLEVIVDVVFNHTAEGDTSGPILSFKGLHNPGWYRLDSHGSYVDWTGTGNTISAGIPHVRETILAALRWWAEGLGVDGFRFDLAVTMGRDQEFDPSHLDWITQDPTVSARKLIAEPWDLGPGGYRLGRFGGEWREWNDRFRNDIRDMWRGRGDGQMLTRRLGGSPDVFESRSPRASVNLVTSHDGFTLADLVAYDYKHNEANREDDADGHDDNRSWNSGREGPTDDPVVLEVRRLRASALLSVTLLASGVPMILGGDELGATHDGNNNAYCLDETNWYDWQEAPLASTVARLTDLRRAHPALRLGEARLLNEDDAILIEVSHGEDRLLLLANPSPHASLVSLPWGTWRTLFDSANPLSPAPAQGDLEVTAWTVLVLGPSH